MALKFDTDTFILPAEVSAGIWKRAQAGSVLAQLSQSSPQKFGQTNAMVLTAAPKAELVAEAAEKSETETTYATKTVTPLKLQVTMRASQEVKWADEDYQIGIFADMEENAGIALGRALDLVGIHGINPLTGGKSSSVTSYIAETSQAATLLNTSYDTAIETAAGLLITGGYQPSGLALDPTAAFGLATQRDTDGRRLYPELGFGTAPTNFEGLQTAISNTVSASIEATGDNATGIIAIVGDFSAFRWGIQRDIAVHVIEYGDPDGGGDLQRQNQIALRAEIVYGIGIMDDNAFALVKSASTTSESTDEDADSSSEETETE